MPLSAAESDPEIHRKFDSLERQVTGWMNRPGFGQPDIRFHIAKIVAPLPVGDAETCEAMVWNVKFVDAEFVRQAGPQWITTALRSQVVFQAAADPDLTFAVGTLVALSRSNDRWWIVEKITDCSSSSSSSSSSSGVSSVSSSSDSSTSSSSDSSTSSASSGSSLTSSATSSSSSGGCLDTIGDTPIADIPNYNAAKKQALIHDGGCVEWMDIEPCDPCPSSAGP